MPRIGISGASGDLGRHITQALLESQPPDRLTLVSRTPERLANHLANGTQVRHGDFRQPETLVPAYRGVDVLMLISGTDVNERVTQHRAAIHAARQSGVRHVVYTSVSGIHPANPSLSVSDHLVTEQDVKKSGLGFTILRNAAYAEAFLMELVQPRLKDGKWLQLPGAGRFAPVSKQDISRCCAAILQAPELHEGATYEISGPELLTPREFSRIVGDVLGKQVDYEEKTPAERLAAWDELGLARTRPLRAPGLPESPPQSGHALLSVELAVARGFQAILSDHVEFITGQPPAPLHEVLLRALDASRMS